MTKQEQAVVRADKAGDRLCAAVATWVKALGGKPAVVGGISVQKFPNELPMIYHVAVKVTGTMPDTAFSHSIDTAIATTPGDKDG